VGWLPKWLTFSTGTWPEALIALAATAYTYAAPIIPAQELLTNWRR